MHSLLPLCLSLILYVWVAVAHWLDDDKPMTLVWLAYGLAQCGFLWHTFAKLYQDKP